ncbi:hypothetical protein LguiA_013467 [Lonicera macranthoides]
MADNSFFLLLFLLTAFYTATAQQRYTNITTGSSLTPTGNSSWQLPSGLYAFGFYRQGSRYSVGIFISSIPEKTVVWTANRDDPPVNQTATLALTADGRLVLRRTQRQETNIAPNSHLAFSASMLNMGNFVLYNFDGDIIWQSFEHPTDTLLVVSASNTYGARNNVTLNLDEDGHLYLFNLSTITLNLTNGGQPKEGRIYLVRNDVDGIIRLYSYNLDQQANWSRLWSSTKWNADCMRNSSFRSCRNNDGSIEYSMWELSNTLWEESSYSTLTGKSKEDCKSACVKDCNCEVALFKDGRCKMQELPLRFGRRAPEDSNMVLVKMESGPNGKRDPQRLPKENKKEVELPILITSVFIYAFLFIVLGISGILIHINRVWAYKMISENENCELGNDFRLRAFTYAELESVTNGFTNEVGSGSFGTVYKGTIQNNQKDVSVKRLEKGLVEGEREFQTKMKAIGKTHHRNLVKLLCYCLEGPKRLLVYEYMSNGSLADILFKHET